MSHDDHQIKCHIFKVFYCLSKCPTTENAVCRYYPTILAIIRLYCVLIIVSLHRNQHLINLTWIQRLYFKTGKFYLYNLCKNGKQGGDIKFELKKCKGFSILNPECFSCSFRKPSGRWLRLVLIMWNCTSIKIKTGIFCLSASLNP